jgi:hypothetical protein
MTDREAGLRTDRARSPHSDARRWQAVAALAVIAVLSCARGNSGRGAPSGATPTAGATPLAATDVPPTSVPPTEAAPSSEHLPTPHRAYTPPDFDAPLTYDRRVVRPADIDPATDAVPDKEHVILFPTDRPLLEPLFVFMSGSGGQPTNNDQILRIAARAGYRTIGLAYVNDISVENRCQGQPDDCAGLVRFENLDGTDRSAYIDVDRANSVEYRLVRLLQGLRTRYPNEGWEAYLDGDNIQWERIVVAGFSQGGGEASFIAGQHLVARAVYVDSGGDLVGENLSNVAVAPWVLESRVTPTDRQFTIVHQSSHYAGSRLYHTALGLTAYGPYVLVEDIAPPYGWTHTLLTNVLPATGTYADAHVSMANDHFMAVDANGLPLLADAFYYLLAP